MKYEVKRVIRNGAEILKLKCPRCGIWGDIDGGWNMKTLNLGGGSND